MKRFAARLALAFFGLLGLACGTAYAVDAETMPLSSTSWVKLPTGASPNWSALRGELVLLETWPSWTDPPIRKDALQSLQLQYRDRGLVVLAISGESPETLGSYLADWQTSYPIGCAELVQRSDQSVATARCALFDRRGRLVWQGAPAKVERALNDQLAAETWSGWLLLWSGWLLSILWQRVQERPFEAVIVVYAFVRLTGTTVDTGWHGVLYKLGRARRTLKPGFHPLIPWLWSVKKLRNRSITLDLARQRVTSIDGMVYEVDANLVYRIHDPIKALIEIDKLRPGCKTALALAVQDLIGSRERYALQKREDLDAALTELLRPRVARWGVDVERAGFTSIAPSSQTLRLSQLEAKAQERSKMLEGFLAAGLPMPTALALLGADQTIISHARKRYRSARPRADRGSRFEIRHEKAE